MEEILNNIRQALQQGSKPEDILQALMQQGVSQEEAVQIIQSAMQEQPQMRDGGGLNRFLPKAQFGNNPVGNEKSLIEKIEAGIGGNTRLGQGPWDYNYERQYSVYDAIDSSKGHYPQTRE